MRSKLLYIALTIFCLSGSAKSQLPEISINHYLETTGEVIIPIYVSNVTNAASVTFSVHYNGDVLEYTGVQNQYFPNIIINNTPVRDAENTYTINAAWFAGGGQGQIIDGVFFEMIFTFSGGSSDFSILNEEFADNSYSIIPINVSSGSIAYQEPIEVALGELFDTPPGLIDIPVFVDFSVVEAGVGAFDFLIEYDHNVLSDPGISDEMVVGIVFTEPEPGQVRLQWENPELYGSQLDGQLLNLFFDFTGGGMSVLTFIHDSGSITNQDGINLPVTFADGFIDGARFDVVFRVNDGMNGQVTNASIVLGDLENQPGDYTFTDVKAGIYSYSVTAPGFSETTGTLELDQNLNISVQIDDIENPVIACPADILNIPADEGVNYAIIANIGEPIVSDNHTPVDDLLVTNNAPENNLYPVGETIVTWTVTDAAGNTANCTQTILVVDDETPPPPLFENLQDITVHHGENVCFDATQTIITAGSNTYFIVEGGGSASLIAGESIRMLPGTSVENGGYLHARITLEGEYCDTPVAKSLEEPVEEPLAEQLVPAMPDKDVLFKVYPNPTTGEFTLELMDALAYKQATSAPAANNKNDLTGSISIETVEALPGDIVDVAVTATGFTGVAAFDCYISFDNHVLDTIDLQNTVINLHPSIAGAFFNVINGDKIAVTWNSMNPVTIPDGQKLFDLRFIFCSELYPCALSGTASPVEFIENLTHFTTADFIEIDLEYNHGGVYAVNPLRALTINQVGSGMVTVDNVTYSEPLVFTEEMSLTLEAFPGLDYIFDGWSGDINGMENPVELLMDENKMVYVTFLQDLSELYILSFDVANVFDEDVEDAVIVLDGESHEPGQYVFDALEPGNYTYSVLHPCYQDIVQELILLDEDMIIFIQLEGFPGDANGDGELNVLDVITMAGYYTENNPHPFCFYNADINQDGAVNVMDIILLIGFFR